MRRCTKCRREFHDLFFYPKKRKGKAIAFPELSKTCKGCQHTQRDTCKRSDPWIAKARRCIRTHAQGFDISEPIFVKEYCWNAKSIAHAMSHAYKNGCPRCEKSFSSMPNGLNDLSLDIIDPSKPPFWPNNVRVLCLSCNQAKGDLSPEEDAIICREWKRWETTEIPPDEQLTLFDSSVDPIREFEIWKCMSVPKQVQNFSQTEMF